MPSDPSRLFFDFADDLYAPLKLAKGPWHPNHQSGAALAGLLAHLVETKTGAAQMPIARLAITILGPGLMQPFQAAVKTLRESHKLAMYVASLSQERIFATACATRIRQTATPEYGNTGNEQPLPPEGLPPMLSGNLSAAVTSRLLRGGLHSAGPGAMWARIEGEIVPGDAITPFVQAAILADFGSGLSGWIDMKTWSFANVDLDMHFLRTPQAGWYFVEASTESSGNGVAITSTRMSDETGLFAQVRQTLFIDRQRTV